MVLTRVVERSVLKTATEEKIKETTHRCSQYLARATNVRVTYSRHVGKLYHCHGFRWRDRGTPCWMILHRLLLPCNYFFSREHLCIPVYVESECVMAKYNAASENPHHDNRQKQQHVVLFTTNNILYYNYGAVLEKNCKLYILKRLTMCNSNSTRGPEIPLPSIVSFFPTPVDPIYPPVSPNTPLQRWTYFCVFFRMYSRTILVLRSRYFLPLHERKWRHIGDVADDCMRGAVDV